MVDFKAFSDETVKIASITSGIIHGGLPGAIVGGLGGMVYDKQDRARGMAHGAGLGFLGGSALGALGTWRPAKRLQDMALDAVGKERELIKRIKASTDYAEQSALSAERRALNAKVEQESKRLGELVQVGGGLPGFAAGLGGGLYAKHKADSQKRSRRKLKTAADMRGLDSEQKEELRQFLKNTALIGIGTGVGGGLATMTHMGLGKLFGPKGRWPNALGPRTRAAMSLAVPTTLGGASLYGYHRMSKKRDELLEEARRRGRRKATSS